MIIEGKPELGLQPHQQEAYKAITEAYKSGNRAAVVMPTGCGKSFIALQRLLDNKDKRILFLAPTNAIRNQMYKYIATYIAGEEPTKEKSAIMIAKEHFSALKIVLYPALLRMPDEIMDKLEPDIIIMDELHRTGAEKWGERVDRLVERNPDAKILGLTATPDRMDDKDVIDKLFNGCIDYELSLIDAVKDGILQAPKYIKCDYMIKDRLEGLRKLIDNCDNSEEKEKLEEQYEHIRRCIEQAQGVPELLSQNLPKRDGKYIVYCPRTENHAEYREHMDKYVSQVTEWFKQIDPEPEIYVVHSDEEKEGNTNAKTIEQFETTKSEHLKLLFSVDMINEGIHVDDISGEIMLRPTRSRIVYLQQLGRVMSSTREDKPIIFDFVNNYLENCVRQLYTELQEMKEMKPTDSEEVNAEKCNDKEIKSGDTKNINLDELIEIFKIEGVVKDFIEIEEEARKYAGNKMLSRARAIKNWMERKETKKPPSRSASDLEELKLAKDLNRIRTFLIVPYRRLKTEEERNNYRETYPELEEIMQIVNWIDSNDLPKYLIYAREIVEWMKRNNTTKPPSPTSKDEEEYRLGNALISIRKEQIKPYMKKTEEERDIYRTSFNPYIDELIEIIEEIDAKNIPATLINARAIKDWMERTGSTKPPSQHSKNAEEKRLGNALSHIRKKINQYRKLQTEDERERYREKKYIEELSEIIEEIESRDIPVSFTNARKIREWMEKTGSTKPPSIISKNNEEKSLAYVWHNIRYSIIKPYMELQTEEEREKYREKNPYIYDFLKIIEEIKEIESRNIPASLINARKIKEWIEKSGDTKPPSSLSKNAEEKRLGHALSDIRQKKIKPYKKLQTEEERFRFECEHPELQEILEIVTWIDDNNVSPYLINAREIKKWVEQTGYTKLPRGEANDEEEKKLGQALHSIRQQQIRPYMLLETDDERIQYRENHPELDEVMSIISDLDIQCGNKKQKELSMLIRQDLEKRKVLQEARKLEQDYEQQLSKQETNKAEKQGVVLDE